MKFTDTPDARERDLCEAYLALPARLENPWALRLVEDSGPLEWRRGQITLLGKATREFRDVVGLSLVRQPFPMSTVVMFNALISVMGYLGAFKTLSPTDPVTWVLIAVINGLLIGSTLATRWVRVEFRDSDGPKFVMLLPKDRASVQKFLHASEELLERLERDVLEKASR